MNPLSSGVALAALVVPFASPALAQDSEPSAAQSATNEAPNAPNAPGSAEAAHPDNDKVIVVTGVRRSAADVLGSVTVMSKDQLARELSPSIGDTLAGLPGVTASSFGPSASRPILRGLSGERVRVLVDGIGSLDLSSSDPDHAVAINPLTAERIEVLRGPGSLLYGSSAIGGVVNVIDTRIPLRVPPGRVSGDLLVNYGTAANERSAAGQANAALGEHLVVHLDANWTKYDDLRTGGYILSRPLREAASESPDPTIRALADLKGKLPNSAGKGSDVAAGLAYIDGGLNIGAALTHHTAAYGVPVRYSLDPAIEAEAPTIDAVQDRADLRVNVPLGGAFSALHLRGGTARYHHKEVGPDGVVGTRFYSNGSEARTELIQSGQTGWGGTSGVQYLVQDGRIRGDEKYLPDSTNRQFGLFSLQTLVKGPWRAEVGGRIEFARVDAKADPAIAAQPAGNMMVGSAAISRNFTPLSGAIGGSYEFASGWRLGLSLSHSERAPSIDELYARGPHAGTQSFLIGNPDLKSEQSNGAELSVRKSDGPVHVEASLYASRFANFLYQSATGAVADGLPVYAYREGKARFTGFEIQGDAKFGRALGVNWGGEMVADAVRATITDVGPAPQIPPLRLKGVLTGARGPVDGRIEVERVTAQNRIAANETRTPGYTMVNLGIDWHPMAENNALTLSLQADNLFDVEARRASSLLKDYAPLAGRNIKASARFSF